jgi:hypothetical protein
MSVKSRAARVWPPATLVVVSGAVEAYAINMLTNGGAARWWWLVVAVAAVGLIVGGVWGYHTEKHADASASEPAAPQSGAVGQQTASGGGSNISISADNNSAAAYQMGTVNVGRPRRSRKRDER